MDLDGHNEGLRGGDELPGVQSNIGLKLHADTKEEREESTVGQSRLSCPAMIIRRISLDR